MNSVYHYAYRFFTNSYIINCNKFFGNKNDQNDMKSHLHTKRTTTKCYSKPSVSYWIK